MEISMSRLPAVRPLCALSLLSLPLFPLLSLAASICLVRHIAPVRPSSLPLSSWPPVDAVVLICLHAQRAPPILHILTGQLGSSSPAGNKIRPATTPPPLFSRASSVCQPREAGGQSEEGKVKPSTFAAFPLGRVALSRPKGPRRPGRDERGWVVLTARGPPDRLSTKGNPGGAVRTGTRCNTPALLYSASCPRALFDEACVNRNSHPTTSVVTQKATDPATRHCFFLFLIFS
ncbi:hypothetical protein LX32DRAFT_34000 [Colletotrichum zoysiae]|uniref:Uncharacterized protein n=1 Tax=Colletotrichum zoysiae TaxID=1216348 RepID=A0AAD9LYY8_9PEZI|nr:hypothetical protein LX32DRAFT_34000 [Colletotrichum zoysiae]